MKGEIKTQVETTQKGMTAELNKVIELMDKEISVLTYLNDSSEKPQAMYVYPIEAIMELKNRILAEVKE